MRCQCIISVACAHHLAASAFVELCGPACTVKHAAAPPPRPAPPQANATQDCSSSTLEPVAWAPLRSLRLLGWTAPVGGGEIVIGDYDPIPLAASQVRLLLGRYGVGEASLNCPVQLPTLGPLPKLASPRLYPAPAPPRSPPPAFFVQFEVQGDQLLINLDADPNTIIQLRCPDPQTSGTVYWRSL